MQTNPTAVNGRYYLTNELTRGTLQVTPAKQPGATVLAFFNGKGKRTACVALSPEETREAIAAMESVSDDVRYSIVEPSGA